MKGFVILEVLALIVMLTAGVAPIVDTVQRQQRVAADVHAWAGAMREAADSSNR